MRVMRPRMAVKVEVQDGMPVRLTHAPAAPAAQEISGAVVWRSGPWRASGEWWSGEGWAREEWDVAVAQSLAVGRSSLALYRLVRDLGSGEWFVEGSYD